MKKNVQDVTVGVNSRNPRNESKIFDSYIAKYFKGKSGAFPLKEQESSIRSVLKIYYQCHGK